MPRGNVALPTCFLIKTTPLHPSLLLPGSCLYFFAFFLSAFPASHYPVAGLQQLELQHKAHTAAHLVCGACWGDNLLKLTVRINIQNIVLPLIQAEDILYQSQVFTEPHTPLSYLLCSILSSHSASVCEVALTQASAYLTTKQLKIVIRQLHLVNIRNTSSASEPPASGSGCCTTPQVSRVFLYRRSSTAQLT